MRLLDLGDYDSMPEEDGGCQHEDGSVDEQSAVQCHYRIQEIPAARSALAGIGVTDLTRLNERRMQVKIVGHDGSPEHGDGDVQALIVDFRNHAEQHLGDDRPGKRDFDGEAGGHHGDEGQNEGFDEADAHPLEPEEQQGIGGSEQDAH